MRRALVLLALIGGLALASCGGDDTLSKEEFVSKADAVCRDVNKQIAALGQPKDLDGLARQAGDVDRITNKNLPRLKELKPPDDQKADFDGFVEGVESQQQQLREIKGLAEDGDQRGILRKSGEVTRINSRANSAAKRAGLKDCGR